MGNEFCCPTLVGRTSAWCLVETSCFCEAIVNRRSRSVLRWQFAPRLHRHDEKPQHSPLANLFELTHEPVLCNGCSSEGIYNSVAQRWRCRRVGFSELLAERVVEGSEVRARKPPEDVGGQMQNHSSGFGKAPTQANASPARHPDQRPNTGFSWHKPVSIRPQNTPAVSFARAQPLLHARHPRGVFIHHTSCLCVCLRACGATCLHDFTKR